MNAYGKWDFLGTANEFTITYPKEPSIKHIGLFNNHLKTGYSDIQQIKDTAIKTAIGRLNNIKNTIGDFETRLYKVIQNTGFKDYSKKSHNDKEDKYYYPDVIIIEVFREIQNRINGTERKLKPDTSKNTIIYAYFESNSARGVLSNKYDYDKINEHFYEFEDVINTLINDNELRETVNRYNLEVNRFYSIQEGSDFQNFIIHLNEEVVNQTTQKLEGSCSHCILKKLISS